MSQHPSQMSRPYKNSTVQKPNYVETSDGPNERRYTPNIIARLMGMDAMPDQSSTVVHAKEIKPPKPSKRPGIHTVRKSPTDSNSDPQSSPMSTPLKQTKCSLLSYSGEQDSGQAYRTKRLTRSRARRHPQEEALQQLKEDFAAWQASRVSENLKALNAENNVQKGKYIQILAQEDLNKEKMARYADVNRNLPRKKVLQSDEIAGKNTEVQEVTKFADKHKRSSSPTRIVILKPSFEKRTDIKQSWVGSSLTRKDCSIEEFLGEVKEKIKHEAYGKSRCNSIARESHKEILCSEKRTDPKQTARDIANHIRESVTRDTRKKLTRSDPFRLRSECETKRSDESLDFIKRDARRILSERLKNVLKDETDMKKSVIGSEVSRASFLIKDRERVRSLTDLSNFGWEGRKTVGESVSRNNHNNTVMVDTEVDLLFRSFSAPVSGTALGKVLLEDENVPTAAHIRRKPETFEGLSGEVQKNRKDTVDVKDAGEFHPMKVIRTIPPSQLNCSIAQDNFTEVPPSPASLSSGSHTESFAPDSVSPVSPLHVESLHLPHFSGCLSFKTSVICQLEIPENEESEEATVDEQPCENEAVEAESHDKTYLRDILVAAGLYEDGAVGQAMPRSISFQVFEEVEETYSRYRTAGDEDPLADTGEFLIDHRMMFDFTNEALRDILGSRRESSNLRGWLIDTATVLQGQILMDRVWHWIETHKNPPMGEMQTIACMAGRDVRTAPWSSTSHEDVYIVGRKIERAVFGELINDLVKEMSLHMIGETR